MNSKRLLIIAGPSKQRSTPNDGLSRALDRYNTVEYIHLRGQSNILGEDMPAVIILSAKYGWINSEKLIKQYVKQMNEERVDKIIEPLRRQYAEVVVPALAQAEYVHLHLPGAYHYALARMGFFIGAHEGQKRTASYNGIIISQLVHWLSGNEVRMPEASDPPDLNWKFFQEESLPASLKTVQEIYGQGAENKPDPNIDA